MFSQLSNLVASYRRTSALQRSCKISLSTISQSSNDAVSMDHFVLDSLYVFHEMEASVWNSSGLVCDGNTMSSTIDVFETTWPSPFWPLVAFQVYHVFNTENLTHVLRRHAIALHSKPPEDTSKFS